MKTPEELKTEVLEWSGLELEGETKEEIKESLKSIHWSLECELDQRKNSFESDIDKLNIPE